MPPPHRLPPPENKKKLTLGRIISNNLFALKIIFKAAPTKIIIGFFIRIINGVFSFLTGAYLLNVVVNAISEKRATAYILTYIIVVWGAHIVYRLINGLYSRIFAHRENKRIQEAVSMMIYNKSTAVEFACYDNPEFYDKNMKAIDAANNRVSAVLESLFMIVWRITELSLNSLLIFTIDPVLILFALFPLLLGFIKKKARELRYEYDMSQVPYNRRKAYVQRAFYLVDYAKEIRLLGMWRQLIIDWNENFKVFKENLKKYGPKRAIVEYISIVGIDVITVIGATFYSVYRTLVSGTMNAADCIVVINSISRVSSTLSNIVTDFTTLGEHASYLEDFRFFLEYEPKIKANEDGERAESGDIVFENVRFRYGGAEADTLKNINVTIKKGERIALVGGNGSGKTTLVKLLLHLYDPTEGTVTLGGKDIRTLNQKSYRELYSVVFQDYSNFSVTVAENILMKELETQEERELVIDSLKKAGMYDKIMSFPKGIDTVLTREFDDDGENLSGGESQKIALARVFAEKRDIAILDEPTSALDPIAEYNMFENMMSATQGKTVLFISHRMSSATLSDRVFLMKDGEIAECGTHAELMEKNGLYAEMFKRQAQNYLGESEANL